jgi:1,4-dihydroxy-2-naphthoate polyprenyltransferase
MPDSVNQPEVSPPPAPAASVEAAESSGKPTRLRQRRGGKGKTLGERLPAPLRPWYLAARPRSFPATYVALFIGGAVALIDARFNLLRFALALLAALLLQIASNLINEYVDFTKGTDRDKVAGMGMVLSQGGLTPSQVRGAAIVSTVLGALIGLFLVTQSHPSLLLVGIFGVVIVVMYTAGPLPLAYLGLGEVVVFLCFGPLMTLGTYIAVAAASWGESWRAFAAGLPIAFTVTAILHANNMRDLDADKAANKKTLAVRFGLGVARVEFTVLIYGAYVASVALVLAGLQPWYTLIAALTLPEAVWLVRVTTRTNKPAQLHMAQGRAARLHLWFGLLTALGWLLAALLKG